MDEWIELRRKIRNEQIPLRQLERETGIHRQTLRKIRDNRLSRMLSAISRRHPKRSLCR